MSLTLGEKLRQAREDKGYTIAEVSEHTRISPQYLASIENDDYSTLPGGIFNKGFLKTYSKFVGVNEQEALLEYSQLISALESGGDGEPRQYRPEVWTDDAGSRSMLPTIVVAVLVLGLMTAGILLVLKYMRKPDTLAGQSTPAANTNTVPSNLAENTPENTSGAAPAMETAVIEFKAAGQDVSLTSIVDGAKPATAEVKSGTSKSFTPKSSLRLKYSKSLASFVQLTINGKPITLPAETDPKRPVIDFEINKDNLPQIWSAGSLTGGPSAAPQANINTTEPASPLTRPTPAARTSAAANAAATPSKPPASPKAVVKPPANAGRPTGNTT